MTSDAHPVPVNGNGGPWSTNEVVRDHEQRIGSLEGWRDRIDGRMDMLKIILGTSIVGTILAGLSLIVAIARPH